MMKLILSLTLIWMLSSTGGALQCYNDSNNTMTCLPGQYCESVSSQSTDGDHRFQRCSLGCSLGNHTVSMNVGYASMTGYYHCCNTSLCNKQLPYPDVQKGNGLQCYGCEKSDSTVCNKTVQCVGIEDRCISGNLTHGNIIAGCASRNLCGPVNVAGIEFTNGTKCCESSFCNSAWTVNLNGVLLLLGLILPLAC